MPSGQNVLLKIRDIQEGLTPVEKRIADYINENAAEIPRLSIKELAVRSGTSDASVLRFCKTVGFSGYRDFIVSISASLSMFEEDSVNQYTDIRPGDDLQTIISNISLNNCKSIEDTMKVIDRAQIEKAVNLLRKSDKIDFYGIGASGLVCMDAQQKFMRINKSCHAYTDSHAQLTAAALLKKGDTAVLISNSGKTAEILDALEVAKESGSSVIAITRNSRSILAEKADVILNISTPEITIRSGAMGSRIAMLNVIDILFAGVASADYQNVRKYLIKTHNVLSVKQKG